MKKYYELLGVHRKSPLEDLKCAIRDRLYELDDLTIDNMIPYVEAYLVLSNPKEKERYDSVPEEEYSFKDRDSSVKEPRKVCEEIERQLAYYDNNIKKKKRGVFAGLLVSIAILLIGLGITFGTYYLASENGGSYFVFYGLIIVGVVKTIKSCIDLRKVLGEEKVAPESRWDDIGIE